jgi:hypothetical protein
MKGIAQHSPEKALKQLLLMEETNPDAFPFYAPEYKQLKKDLEVLLHLREEEKKATVEEAAKVVQHGVLANAVEGQVGQMADAAEEAGAPALVHHPDDVA